MLFEVESNNVIWTNSRSQTYKLARKRKKPKLFSKKIINFNYYEICLNRCRCRRCHCCFLLPIRAIYLFFYCFPLSSVLIPLFLRVGAMLFRSLFFFIDCVVIVSFYFILEKWILSIEYVYNLAMVVSFAKTNGKYNNVHSVLHDWFWPMPYSIAIKPHTKHQYLILMPVIIYGIFVFKNKLRTIRFIVVVFYSIRFMRGSFCEQVIMSVFYGKFK